MARRDWRGLIARALLASARRLGADAAAGVVALVVWRVSRRTISRTNRWTLASSATGTLPATRGASGVVGIREPPGLLAPAEPPGQTSGDDGAGLAGVDGAHQPCGAVHLHQFGAGGRACAPPVVVAGQGAEPPDGPAVGTGVVPEGGAGDGAERG